MTGDQGDGDTVDSIVDKAVERADPTPDTFRPVSVDDRFEKRVRDDHAPNQALHDALKAAAEDDDRIHSVNLIGSHAPGNRHKGEPRYHVRVDIRNDGMGHPVLGATVAGRMVDRGDVRITDVAECSDDHLVVCLRPREVRVEPIDVPVDDIPDDFVRYSQVEHDAAFALRGAVNKFGVDDPKTQAAEYALGLALAPNDPERQDEPHGSVDDTRDRLLRAAGVDPESREVTGLTPTDDGYLWEGPQDDRVADVVKDTDIDDADDLRDAARMFLHSNPYAGFPFTEVGRGPPTGRPPVDPIREWVEDREHLFDTAEDPETIAGLIADAIAYGGDPDTVFAPCGCGDYRIAFPSGDVPESFDVVCPECGNHFGHGAAPDEPCPCDHDHDADDVDDPTDVIDFPDDFDAAEPGYDPEDFLPYSERAARRPRVGLWIQDKDNGEIVERAPTTDQEWVEVDTGRGIYNVRTAVGHPDKSAAETAVVYRCHGCERRVLPEDFRVPSCSCDQEDGDACDECGGHAGPRCPRCGTEVDWGMTKEEYVGGSGE